MKTHCKEAHAEQWKADRGKRTSQGRAAPKPCQICGIEFPQLQDLNQHLAEAHEDSEARALKCTTCSRWLSTRLKLQNHMRTHTGERPFTCKFCPKSFPSANSMYGHQKDSHKEEYEQNKELIIAQNKEEGKRKQRESHRNGTRKERWDYGIKYGVKTGRGRKLSTMAAGNEDGEVPILDEQTGMMNKNLMRCEFCDKAYINKSCVLAHQRKDHEQEYIDKRWMQRTAGHASDNPCPQCGENFPLKSVLNKHLAEVHEDTDAMKLQCNICKKYLGSRVLLEDHIRTHTGERPYKCNFCPKKFTSNKAMGFHRKEQHHEEWEANKAQIMAQRQALAHAKRGLKFNQKDACGKDNGETALLDESTGMIFK